MSGSFFPSAMRVAPELPPVAPGPRRERLALLVNPFYPKDPHASFGKHLLTPTLVLTSLAAATPERWAVRLWDENLLQGPPPHEPFPHVVGMTVHLTFARRAYELAHWYRSRGALVILGGADAVALGEGVQLWTTSVIATRSCHNRCGFCYLATDGLHVPYRMRAPEQVAREIAADGRPYAVFIDNNLGSRPGYLRRLCRHLRPLGIVWSAAVTIDVTDDPSLVREMALAGCIGVFVGFESLDLGNLLDARKKTPAPADYGRRVRVFHDHGIQVNGSFVLEFDHDGPDVFARSVDWIESNRLECATFQILTPYPRTPLFRRMEEGRLLHRDWSLYDTAHAVFRPARMTAEQLEEGYAWCYRRLFSHASIWRRRPTDPRAVPAYLAMSYLYKRSNRVWHALIRRCLTARVWLPLIELSRRRHLTFRQRLAGTPAAGRSRDAGRERGRLISTWIPLPPGGGRRKSLKALDQGRS